MEHLGIRVSFDTVTVLRRLSQIASADLAQRAPVVDVPRGRDRGVGVSVCVLGVKAGIVVGVKTRSVVADRVSLLDQGSGSLVQASSSTMAAVAAVMRRLQAGV